MIERTSPTRRARLSALASAFILVPLCAAAAPAPPPAAAKAAVESVSPDGIEVAGYESSATRVESSKEAWGGERGSFGGDGQPLSQRVASYALTAVLDPVLHTIEGTEELRWTNRSDRPVRSLYFHLYLNAFEGEGSTFMTEKAKYGAFRSDVPTRKGEWGWIDLKSVVQEGKPAQWTYVHPDGGPETDHTVVRVDLPAEVAAGATATLQIAFHDQLPRVVARTGWFAQYHLVAQWFPKLGVLELPGERGATSPRWNAHELHLFSEFYADFGNYNAVITAPADYLVRATGEEQGEPAQTPQGLAHRFAQEDVHDFVFTAWNGYAPPLAGSYDGPGSPHVQVEVLYPPEQAAAARAALQGTLDALRYFSSTLGPYPYRHVTCVVPPFNATESGGMEYETFFTTIGTSPVISESIVRYVTVHEFGHGYFMGLLASNEFEEPFLDEGMNEYWDSRMLGDEPLDFNVPAPLRALGVQLPSFSWWDFERMGGTQRFQADPIAGSSWKRYSSGSYGLVYARTALVMHDLEQQLGADAMGRGMKLYYQRWHHRHPGTADLRAALAEGSGQPELAFRWFEAQVYRNAPVDDRVVKVESEELVPKPGTALRDGKRVERDEPAVKKEIEETRAAWKKAHPADGKSDEEKKALPGPYPFRSAVLARRYAAQVPEAVLVKFADGTEEKLDWAPGEAWHRWVFEKPVKITSAQLDPERRWLLDLNKLDDGKLREPAPLASRRWTVEAGAWISLALSLLVTQ